MPVNPRSLENLVSKALESGVTSEVYRVRASIEVQNWFHAMTAERRGEVLTEARAAMIALGPPIYRSVLKKSRADAGAKDEPDKADILDGLTLLRVASTSVPQSLKNVLRWMPHGYTKLDTVLMQTQTVRLVTATGKSVWRIDDGASMRKDTVKRLFDAGILVASN